MDKLTLKDAKIKIAELEARIKELEYYLPENVSKRRYQQYLKESDPTGMKCIWCDKIIEYRLSATKNGVSAAHNICREEMREDYYNTPG